MSKPTHVIVDKRNFLGKQKGKWRVSVVYKPKHPPVHILSQQHKEKAVTAGNTLAIYLNVPLTVYTSSGAYAEAVTTHPTSPKTRTKDDR